MDETTSGNRRRTAATKVLGALGIVGAAAAVAGLGVFGSSTDSTTPVAVAATDGVVSIGLTAAGGGASVPLDYGSLVPGAAVTKAVDLVNDGTTALSLVDLATVATTSSILDTDATNGLQTTVRSCSVAWSGSWSCSGDLRTLLSSGPVVRSGPLAAPLSLVPGATDHLAVTVALPTTAGDDFKLRSSDLSLVFTAVQRARHRTLMPAGQGRHRSWSVDRRLRSATLAPVGVPREGPGVLQSPPVEVRPLAAADRFRAAATLASAFSDDPVFTFLLPPGVRHREQRIRRFFALEVSRSRRLGGAWTTADGTGVAVWFPPRRWKPSVQQTLRTLPAALRIFGRHLPLAGSVAAVLQEHHPQRPHWYLAYLAVEPAHQGRGTGTALLEPVLARCDRQRVPVHLEATSDRNRALYLRHGFQPGEPLPLPGGPSVHPMWREPR